MRYISNHSSGKMGYALAQAAVDAGALTTLVSGPVNLAPPDHVRSLGLKVPRRCWSLPGTDAGMRHFHRLRRRRGLSTRRRATAENKEGRGAITLQLSRNPDIVAAVAASEDRPFTVGFAAETNDVLSYARDKMRRKGLDMIVANDVSDQSIGFNSDDNEVTAGCGSDGEQMLARAGQASHRAPDSERLIANAK